MKGNVELPNLGRRKADRNPPSSHGAERWEEGVGWECVTGRDGGCFGGVVKARAGLGSEPCIHSRIPSVRGELNWDLSHGRVGCRCPRLPRKVVLRCLETRTRSGKQCLLCADTSPTADPFGSLRKQILSLERLLHLLTICSSAALVSKTVLLYFISSVCLFCLYLFCISSFCCFCSGRVFPM